MLCRQQNRDRRSRLDFIWHIGRTSCNPYTSSCRRPPSSPQSHYCCHASTGQFGTRRCPPIHRAGKAGIRSTGLRASDHAAEPLRRPCICETRPYPTNDTPFGMEALGHGLASQRLMATFNRCPHPRGQTFTKWHKYPLVGEPNSTPKASPALSKSRRAPACAQKTHYLLN